MGDYKATVTFTGSYAGTVEKSFSITPAGLTVTANDQTCTYDGFLEDTTYNDPDQIAKKAVISGLQGSDKVTMIRLTGQAKEAGETEIEVTGIAINSGSDKAEKNYSITKNPGKLTISPKPVTATVTAVDRDYIAGSKAVSLTPGTVDGIVAGDAVTVDVSAAAGEIADANVGKDKAVTVTGVKLSGDDAGNYALSSQPTGVTVTINRAAPDVVSAPTAKTLTYDGSAQALVTAGEATGGDMQYAPGDASKATGAYTASIPKATDAGTWYVWYRVKGDSNHEDSKEACVEVRMAKAKASVAKAPAAIDLTYDGSAQALVTAGEATGGDMQYAIGDASKATEAYTESIPKATDAGTWYVWYRVKGDSNHEDSKEACVEVRMAKAKASVAKAPAAIDLTYDGSAQALVTAGEATGGDMQYAPGDASKATGAYTASIPTGTDTGTWYVWYRVKGDGNHEDYTASAPVAVTIGQVNKDALNDAIRSAETFYAEIKDNTAYSGIAETLKNAIDAAGAVADNPNVTEDQVKAAAGSVAEAEKTARADKAAADKEAADKAAAKAVEDIVNALPDSAGLGDRDAVEAARAAYEALTEDQKKLVPEDALARLDTAERQVREAEDEAAAKKVTDIINALPDSAGLGDRDAVDAARAAYDVLTEDQKKLVPEDALARLATAEQQVREAEDEARKVRITDCKITVKDQAYTGKALKPDVTVKHGKTTLTAGTDYTVTYRDNVKPGTATATVKGKGDYTGSAEVTFAIRVPLSMCKLTVKDQAYTGKALKPAVTVKYGKVTLKKGTDYTVTYADNVKPGTATVTVKGKGKYTGSQKVTFKIVPKGTAFSKLTGGNKQLTLEWDRQANITGYQIQYSLKSGFSGGKMVTVNKAGTVTTTIKGLKAGKKYYVRIRTYATVKKVNYCSAWSKAKAVETASAKGNATAQAMELELQAGETLDLNALFPGGDAWASGDAAVVAVSEGFAKALAAGEAVVSGYDAEGEAVIIVITVAEDGIEALEPGVDLALPVIDDAIDGGIVMGEVTGMTMD